MTKKDISSGTMTSERSVRDTKIIGSRFLKITRDNTESTEDGNEVALEEEGGEVKIYWRTIGYQHVHFFLIRLWSRVEYKK